MIARTLTFAVLCLATLASAAEVVLKDDFSDPKLEQRRASRGDWQFANGVASCTQDDELYKKFKDHGPIIFYDVALRDMRVRFSFKPEGARSVVFTANGEGGHVFRFVMSERGTSIRAFPPEEKEHKSIALGTEAAAPLKSGEWVPVEVDLRGGKATVKIGGLTKTCEHASLDRPKTNISIGFSFGSLAVKDVVIER